VLEVAATAPPISMMNWVSIWTCVGVTFGVLILTILWPTVGLAWKENATSAFLQTFGGLGLAALFVERVVEVFVAIWQDPQVDGLEQQAEFQQAIQVDRRKDIGELEAKLARPGLEPAVIAALRTKLQDKETELDNAERQAEAIEARMVGFKATTRRLATCIAMLVGVLTAAVGFRILNNLVTIDASKLPPGSWQYSLFIVMDVLFTGAVLAGGSKAVHQVFNVYEALMDSSQSVLQKKKLETAPPVPPPSPPSAT
jgi:hypothetical protein